MTVELEGPAAPPRRNGDLVFEAPWQGRAFGLAVALAERGVYGWDDFRARLVDAVAADDARAYYAAWLSSLERLLVERGLVSEAELERRVAELAHADEHAHDHDHDHGR